MCLKHHTRVIFLSFWNCMVVWWGAHKTEIFWYTYISFFFVNSSQTHPNHIFLKQQFHTFPLHVYENIFFALSHSHTLVLICIYTIFAIASVQIFIHQVMKFCKTTSQLNVFLSFKSSPSYVALFLLPVCNLKTPSSVIFTYGKHTCFSTRGKIHHTFFIVF